MKKLLLLSGFIFLALALAGQSRWAFGLNVAGGYSGKADLQEQTYPDDQFGDYYTKSEIKRQPSLGVGIWTEYLLSHRFGLRLGVDYNRWRTFSESEYISYNVEDVILSYSRDRYYEQQNQLSLPLEGKLYFGKPDHRVRFFVKTGVQADYLLSQTYIVNNFYGGLGQTEIYENNYGEKIDLDAEWMDIKRWQLRLTGGLGVTMDRATLSLQRSWGFQKVESYTNYPYYGCCGFGGLCNCVGPSYYGGGRYDQQLRQTSVRFSYRLF